MPLSVGIGLRSRAILAVIVIIIIIFIIIIILVVIIIINRLMPVQQNSFTHLTVIIDM
jgi:hypothetical protein